MITPMRGRRPPEGTMPTPTVRIPPVTKVNRIAAMRAAQRASVQKNRADRSRQKDRWANRGVGVSWPVTRPPPLPGVRL